MPEFHELANAFPLLTGEAYDELKKDIQEHGQIDPVVLFEGKILDGRNRWRAMQELGLPHKETKLGKDVDPVAWVWSKNAVRRQLTPAQKAMAATKLVTTKSGDNQHTKGQATSVGQAAALAGVSERSVQRAKKVLDNAVPEVVAAVEGGELGIVPAELISERPVEIQKNLIAKGPKAAAKAVAKEDDTEVTRSKADGPGRGHVGPEVTMTKQMEQSSAEGSKSRVKFWAENKDMIAKLDGDLLKRFTTDLAAERRAIEQLLRLIKAETETASTPRSDQTTKGADVPVEPTKVAARKTTARRTAAAKSTTEKQETAK